MKLTWVQHRDIVAGLVFFAMGAGVAWGSTAYTLGNAMRMGPGYFPFLLGVLLAGLGLTLVVRHLRELAVLASVPRIEKPCLRSLLLVGSGMLLFALLLQHGGLIVATVALVSVSGVAYRAFRWHELGLLSSSLAVFAVAVFVYGLGLPLQVLPA